MNKILNLCETPRTIQELADSGVPKSTVYHDVKELVKKGRLLEVVSENPKKYQNPQYKNVIPHEYLQLIIDRHRSKDDAMKLQAVGEVYFTALSPKRILDKEYIDFIINEDIKFDKEGIYESAFSTAFSTIVENLRNDIIRFPGESNKQTELLKHIMDRTGEYNKKIALDTKSSLKRKVSAIHKIIDMNHPQKYDILFDLLKTIKYEIPESEKLSTLSIDLIFHMILREIKNYSEKYPVNCRNRLYEIYDLQKDKNIKERIQFLLDISSYGADAVFMDEKDNDERYVEKFVIPHITKDAGGGP